MSLTDKLLGSLLRAFEGATDDELGPWGGRDLTTLLVASQPFTVPFQPLRPMLVYSITWALRPEPVTDTLEVTDAGVTSIQLGALEVYSADVNNGILPWVTDTYQNGGGPRPGNTVGWKRPQLWNLQENLQVAGFNNNADDARALQVRVEGYTPTVAYLRRKGYL